MGRYFLTFISLTEDENDDSNKDDDEEDTPDPDEVFNSYSRNSQNWSLPSGKTVEGIFSMNVSEYSKRYKQKKRLTPVERAVLRYGASRLIDLSAHMRAWFTNNDRHFMTKNYEDMLKVPELPEDINMFISTIEKKQNIR